MKNYLVQWLTTYRLWVINNLPHEHLTNENHVYYHTHPTSKGYDNDEHPWTNKDRDHDRWDAFNDWKEI